MNYRIPTICLILLVSGCTAGSRDAVEGTSTAIVDGQAEIETLVDNASAYQQKLIADGVTRSDYEQAALAAEDCMLDAGLTAEIAMGDPLITIGSGEDWSLGGGAVGTVPDAAAACYDDRLAAVEAIFILSEVASQDDIENQTSLFYDCLRDLGYPIPDDPEQDPTTGDIVDSADYDEMLGCWEAAGV